MTSRGFLLCNLPSGNYWSLASACNFAIRRRDSRESYYYSVLREAFCAKFLDSSANSDDDYGAKGRARYLRVRTSKVRQSTCLSQTCVKQPRDNKGERRRQNEGKNSGPPFSQELNEGQRKGPLKVTFLSLLLLIISRLIPGQNCSPRRQKSKHWQSSTRLRRGPI